MVPSVAVSAPSSSPRATCGDTSETAHSELSGGPGWTLQRGARKRRGFRSLECRDGGLELGRRGRMVHRRIEPDRLADDELDVAPEGGRQASLVDDRHAVDLQLDRHDRRPALDRDQPRTGLERLERATHAELALGVDQDAVALVHPGAEELEA